ncbi:AdoMet_MTases domain containing protein [Candidatus Methylopumilus universalis]
MKSNELNELYKIRFARDQLKRKNDIWVVITTFLQKFIKDTDFVIDVGCGYGEFINNIRAGRKIAIDLNEDSKRFINKDIFFKSGISLKDLNKRQDIRNQVDIVFTSNFLEHLPSKKNLDCFLTDVFITLKPGGKYIVLGPNIRYVPHMYWDYYDHHIPLSHLSLCEALRLRGFKIQLCIDRFLPFTINGKLPTHPFLVSVYLNNPWAWKILGKQFFIVAEKPNN